MDGIDGGNHARRRQRVEHCNEGTACGGDHRGGESRDVKRLPPPAPPWPTANTGPVPTRVTVAWTAAEWGDAFRRGGEKQNGLRARNS